MHLSPAEYVIHQFGGVRKTARAIGRAPSSVSKWQNHKGPYTSPGDIPQSVHRKILTAAEKLKIDIKPEDLILGRSLKKSELISVKA